MRNIILFDNETRDNLLPFTYIRPACELRTGVFTIREKWEIALDGKASFITQDYLTDRFDITISERNYLINGTVLPTPELISLIAQLENGQALILNEELIAATIDKVQFERLMQDDIKELVSYELTDESQVVKINHLWDLFKCLHTSIVQDFEVISSRARSTPLSNTNTLIGSADWLFIDKGAYVEGATLNTTAGPIYIGENATVMEGAIIRGPFVLGEKGVVKMGAKIYGPTTAGPHTTLGGELKNVLLLEHASKGHEGYIGNSVIGSWCNIGADTNCSNLKNNWTQVKLWNYGAKALLDSGELKAGVFLGDYTMTGINTMFNTGTVVGLSCNIFGTGFPPKFIPSFSWGGAEGLGTYQMDKAIESIERMMHVHKQPFTPEDRLLLITVFEESTGFRK